MFFRRLDGTNPLLQTPTTESVCPSHPQLKRRESCIKICESAIFMYLSAHACTEHTSLATSPVPAPMSMILTLSLSSDGKLSAKYFAATAGPSYPLDKTPCKHHCHLHVYFIGVGTRGQWWREAGQVQPPPIYWRGQHTF